MIISIIAAMDRNRLIGNKNQLPWRLPADLAHFKKTTMGKPVVMGRKTYESIGKPLPGRTNIVLTRSKEFCIDGVEVCHSIEEIVDTVPDVDEIMIIGGSNLYQQILASTERMYITWVDAELSGDTWFPDIDFSRWQVIEEETRRADDKNPYSCRFVTYQKL